MLKANRDNTIMILHKNDFISRLNQILDNTSKFKRLHIEKREALNHLIYMEKRNIDLLKNSKHQNKISEKNYDNLYN